MSASTTYRLQIFALGAKDYVPLTRAEFAAIQNAKRLLLLALAIEEKLDVLVGNYRELEHELLTIAVDYSVFRGDFEAQIGEINTINRRLLNYLSATRQYRDQSKHAFGAHYGRRSPEYQILTDAVEAERSTSLGYRVMEALRDYVQHRDAPCHMMVFNNRPDDSTTPHHIEHVAIPMVSTEELADDPRFDREVLRDLEQVKDDRGYAEWMPFVREQIDAFGRIHKTARGIVDSEISSAATLIEKWIERGRERFGNVAGLVAWSADDRGCAIEVEHLLERQNQRRSYYVDRKYRVLPDMARRFVSSRQGPRD